jgi:hypothetical protein
LQPFSRESPTLKASTYNIGWRGLHGKNKISLRHMFGLERTPSCRGSRMITFWKVAMNIIIIIIMMITIMILK